MKKLAVLKKTGPLFLRALSFLPSQEKEHVKNICKQISILILKKYYDIYSVPQIYQSCYNTIGCLSIGLFKITGSEKEVFSTNVLKTMNIQRIFQIGFNEILQIATCKSEQESKFLEFGFDSIYFERQLNLSKQEAEIFMLELLSGEPDKFWSIEIFRNEIEKYRRYSFLKWFFQKYFNLKDIPEEFQHNPLALYESAFKASAVNLIFPDKHQFERVIQSDVPKSVMIKYKARWKEKIEKLSAEIIKEFIPQYKAESNKIWKTYISKNKPPQSILFAYDFEKTLFLEHQIKMEKDGITDNNSIKRRTKIVRKRLFGNPGVRQKNV